MRNRLNDNKIDSDILKQIITEQGKRTQEFAFNSVAVAVTVTKRLGDDHATNYPEHHNTTLKMLRDSYQPYYSFEENTPSLFTMQHAYLVIYFVTGHHRNSLMSPTSSYKLEIEQRRLTLEQAIMEINQLNSHQLDALEQGYTIGLRGSILRSWQHTTIEFSSTHKKALISLIQEQHMPAKDAMELINGKTREEVKEIIKTYSASPSSSSSPSF